MKLKHKLLVSAISGLLVAPAAMAEDVMKVYGQVNISINNSSGDNMVGRSSGTDFNSNASRFGLMGSLGTTIPNTKMTYVAEMEYTTVGENGADDDDDPVVFGREATVGLNNSNIGHLRMGRLTQMYKSNYARMDPWTDHVLQARASGQQGASALNANYFNNAVEFRSANFSGFEFSAFYSANKNGQRLHNAGPLSDFEGGNAHGFGIRYIHSDFRIALDSNTIDAKEEGATTNGTANKITAEYKVSPQISLGGHYEDVSDMNMGTNIFAVGAYRMGNALFTASYGLNQGGSDNRWGSEDATTLGLGTKYKLNRRSDIIAGYSTHSRGNQDVSTFTVGFDAKFGY